MIILVKTPTVTFSLDVAPTDKVEVLVKKVCERTGLSDYQFQLVFAGEPLEFNSTVQSHGIKKEGTIHLQTIKELSFDVNYESAIVKVTVPNAPNLLVANLKRTIITTLSPNYPKLGSLPLQLTQGDKVLNDKDNVHQTVKRTENLVLSQVTGSGSGNGEEVPTSQDQLPDLGKDDMIAHFMENNISNDVEIVFCFDTTGSMNAVIVEVRKKVVETVTRLMKEIPSIRIGIMALGDFCEERPLYTLDLTNDVDKIVKFINSVKSTSGGDEPECYEFALHKAKLLSWSKHTSKSFVMIGDSPPHPPSYTNHHINWIRECDDLDLMGVKVYGVVAIHEGYKFFYQTISERTGGLCITFSRFDLITDMFLAICFREASAQKYEQYKKEAKERGEGGESLDKMFADLDKPNFIEEEKPQENTTIPESSTSSPDTTPNQEGETTTTTTTTTTTPTPTAKKAQPIKKYGVVLEYPKGQDWVEFLDDDLAPNPLEKFSSPMFGSKYKGNGEKKKSNYKSPLIGMVVGSQHIGFKSFQKTLCLENLSKERNLYFNDYRLDIFKSLPYKSLFVGMFAVDQEESFQKLSEKITTLKKEFPTTLVYLIGLKSDTRKGSSTATTENTDKDGKEPVTNPTPVKFVEKSEIDLLLRNSNLSGYSEVSINSPSSITNLEKAIMKLYQQANPSSK